MSIPDDTLQALEANTAQVLSFLESLSDAQAALRPADDKWNILEIVEHIATSEFGTAQLMGGQKVELDRDPAAKVDMMSQTFRKDDQSYAAPAQLVAVGRYQNLADAKDGFSKARNAMQSAALQGDASLGCASFPHPGFGLLSQLEWVYFSIIHAERHLRQIQQLASA